LVSAFYTCKETLTTDENGNKQGHLLYGGWTRGGAGIDDADVRRIKTRNSSTWSVYL